MGCMSGLMYRDQAKLLQMHTVVIRPLTTHDVGSISCRPMGREPIQFEWSGGSQGMILDASESEASNVTAGRYRIQATDAAGDYADVVVEVQPIFPDAVVISEYRVRPSTTRFSRDGLVEAIGTGFTANMRFHWTTGVETDAPILTDIPHGTYSVTAISDIDPHPITVHRCSPARVGVA